MDSPYILQKTDSIKKSHKPLSEVWYLEKTTECEDVDAVPEPKSVTINVLEGSSHIVYAVKI